MATSRLLPDLSILRKEWLKLKTWSNSKTEPTPATPRLQLDNRHYRALPKACGDATWYSGRVTCRCQFDGARLVALAIWCDHRLGQQTAHDRCTVGLPPRGSS